MTRDCDCGSGACDVDEDDGDGDNVEVDENNTEADISNRTNKCIEAKTGGQMDGYIDGCIGVKSMHLMFSHIY